MHMRDGTIAQPSRRGEMRTGFAACSPSGTFAQRVVGWRISATRGRGPVSIEEFLSGSPSETFESIEDDAHTEIAPYYGHSNDYWLEAKDTPEARYGSLRKICSPSPPPKGQNRSSLWARRSEWPAFQELVCYGRVGACRRTPHEDQRNP
jgi:hypothetical protein